VGDNRALREKLQNLYLSVHMDGQTDRRTWLDRLG